MRNARPAIVSWSGGKDSALALWTIRDQYQIHALVTTITRQFDRVSMHGVRRELMVRQAAALDLPLETMELPWPCTNEDYESSMRAAFAQPRAGQVPQVICGDLFLQDVRRYREEKLLGPGQGVFPLWNEPTAPLARRFIDMGFQAILCCVDTQALSADFVGRAFDHQLLADLPPTVDPCGENGEFHTFVWNGPNFRQPVQVKPGEHVLREERFAYCDLLPNESLASTTK